MSYTHLTRDERFCLEELRQKGLSMHAIACMLGRSASTISRELKRNCSRKGCHPYYAYSLAMGRRRKPKVSSLQSDPLKRQYVIEKLQLYWSPEQIANCWKKEHPESSISISTIYRHIRRNLLPGICRKKHLRRRGKRIVHRNSNYNTIHPDRIIPQWPDVIRQRARIGDWEGDTICGGKGMGFAVTLVDRKTGFLCGRVIQSKDAATTCQAILDALDGLPVHNLSLDNGAEFAELRMLEQQLDSSVFFAEPHKPWQRGTNENTNGLLRFFFPNGCDFRSVSQADFDRAVYLINSRPRKRFDWLSPLALFSVALP